jgi:anion-transporting  ArsA/GET3 family ATPase
VSLTSKRLLIVTGKGGVGKSTVAAALGLAAAAVGHRVAVVELAGHTRMPRLFGLPARTDGRLQALHPNLESLTIDPARVLEEELATHLPVRAVARGLAENRAVATIASAAPGLRELLALSAVANLLDGPHDLAVVDGPATGHALGLVDVPETVAAIARMGPVRSRADRLGRLLADGTSTAVVLVSTPDELSVSEALEAWDELAGGSVTAAGVIANMVLPALFEPGDGALLDALPDDVPPTGRAAIDAARGRMGRTALERERLDRLPAVLAELPLLFGEALDRDDVIDLSELLEGV